MKLTRNSRHDEGLMGRWKWRWKGGGGRKEMSRGKNGGGGGFELEVGIRGGKLLRWRWIGGDNNMMLFLFLL